MILGPGRDVYWQRQQANLLDALMQLLVRALASLHHCILVGKIIAVQLGGKNGKLKLGASSNNLPNECELSTDHLSTLRH